MNKNKLNRSLHFELFVIIRTNNIMDKSVNIPIVLSVASKDNPPSTVGGTNYPYSYHGRSRPTGPINMLCL